ncbi:hypothetical protein BCR35DRAFT_332213 [Leucosporidium creatinivorum]|uniref:F-box domain-containing protein n=1 Tax=Leucosporidium creatinivorum TaxID=106004 RepID=A0A1Y2F4U1_9BASI|nr:hypothetical protein BCR35DRAFT_332213 [Leucosporidium creatinivorum]
MAVIQDLPAELLYRILELGAWRSVAEIKDIEYEGLNLNKTALVARKWTDPSQHLLIRHATEEEVRNMARSPEAIPSSCAVEKINADLSPTDEAFLELLAKRKVRVRQLTVWSLREKDRVAGYHPTLFLEGVERLMLERPLYRDSPKLVPSKDLRLQFLSIRGEYPPPLAFFESLVLAAPRLTRLEIEWSHGATRELPAMYQASLNTLAPRLRHLCLRNPSSPVYIPPRAFNLSPFSFLSKCTALVRFSIIGLEAQHVIPLLELLPPSAPIVVLSTALNYRPEFAPSHDLHRVLPLLELPALSKLKRWRFWYWNDTSYPREFKTDGPQITKRWTAACEAKGVEPRGPRRFFTDWPA